jgi:hypothetical protein
MKSGAFPGLPGAWTRREHESASERPPPSAASSSSSAMIVPAALPSVFVLGDSISIHYGPYLAEALGDGFRYDRKRAPEDATLPDQANGGDSGQVLAYLRSAAGRAIPPGFLLLNCGLHDIKLHPGADSCQVPVDRYESNLEESLRCCAERALQAIWVRTTPVVEALHRARSPGFDRREADLAAYNTRADRVMGRHGIPTVDLHRFTLPFLPGGVVDHVHFGVEVRRLQGAFLAGFIQGRWSGLTEAGR